jgi:hypothetical protein
MKHRLEFHRDWNLKTTIKDTRKNVIRNTFPFELALPTVSLRVKASNAAMQLKTDKMIAMTALFILDITMYGAIKEPNLEKEMQIACPKVLISVDSNSGVANHVAFCGNQVCQISRNSIEYSYRSSHDSHSRKH